VLTGEVNVPQVRQSDGLDPWRDRQLTFYTRHGELFAKLCACVTLIAIITLIALRRLKVGAVDLNRPPQA
jgi:hypothetical protein